MYYSSIRICGIILLIFAVSVPATGFLRWNKQRRSNSKCNLQVQNNTKTQIPKTNRSFCNEAEIIAKKEKLIKINVGGEILIITREILTRVRNSKLAFMVNGNCTSIPALDTNGYIFLDYNPTVFRHLLEQLRLLDGCEQSPVFYPPSSRLLVPAFKQMLEQLGLVMAPMSDDDIITLNVGGEIFVTRRRILTQISHSRLVTIVSSYERIHTDENGCLFLDYDARLFRHLLLQLRTSACQKQCIFQPPTLVDAEAFNSMLFDLGLIDIIPSPTTSYPPTETSLISQNVKITASNFCTGLMSSCAASVYIEEQLKDILYPNRSTSNHWNSRGYAPQYIQLEFKEQQTVSEICLQVDQTPNGNTSHSLLVGTQIDDLKEVKALIGLTKKYEWINLTFNPPLKNVRFLRIKTITSPSWVSWFKFLVYGN